METLRFMASVMCKSAHEKILEIYSNDGPGFSREFQELPEMKEMMPKIIRIIPEYSIIGTLRSMKKNQLLLQAPVRDFSSMMVFLGGCRTGAGTARQTEQNGTPIY